MKALKNLLQSIKSNWKFLIVVIFMLFYAYELIQINKMARMIRNIESDVGSIQYDISSIEHDVRTIELDVSSIRSEQRV